VRGRQRQIETCNERDPNRLQTCLCQGHLSIAAIAETTCQVYFRSINEPTLAHAQIARAAVDSRPTCILIIRFLIGRWHRRLVDRFLHRNLVSRRGFLEPIKICQTPEGINQQSLDTAAFNKVTSVRRLLEKLFTRFDFAAASN